MTMSNSPFFNKLKSDGKKFFLRVKIGNTYIPYTLLKKYNVPEDDDKYIFLYNLITESCDKLKKSDITSYQQYNSKIVDNIRNETTFIKKCKDIYKKAVDKNISKEVFYNTVMNKTVINNDLQQAVCDFNFAISEDILNGSKIPADKKDNIRNAFIKLIEEKIESNKAELNTIRKDCDTDEDREDIDSIVEMFDDCKEELDIEDIDNIKDLLESWPPLLLPLPDKLEKILTIKPSIVKELSEVDEFKEILSSINDIQIVEDFDKILNDQIDIDNSNVYKDYKDLITERLKALKS